MPKRWIKLLKRLRNDFKIEYFPNGETAKNTMPCFRVRCLTITNPIYTRHYINPDVLPTDNYLKHDKQYETYEKALYSARASRIAGIRMYYNRKPKVKKSDGKRY